MQGDLKMAWSYDSRQPGEAEGHFFNPMQKAE